MKVKVCKLHNLECSVKRKELQYVCITNAQCNITLVHSVQPPCGRVGKGLTFVRKAAAWAGRRDLLDPWSCPVRALAGTIQHVVPVDAVPTWFVFLKASLNPPVVCSTDRSKAVVPVLVLLFVVLWFILRGDLLYVFPRVVLFLCFSVLLVLRLPRLGKRELILVLFVRLFGLCLFRFVGFASSWGLGRAAVCDCGTPWTFLLPFFFNFFVMFLVVGLRSGCFGEEPCGFIIDEIGEVCW